MLKVYYYGLLLLPLALLLPLLGGMLIPPLPYSFSGQENDSDSEVKVEIFYEALCPDSKNFFVDTLEPVLSQFNRFISITLVPYGKAKLTKSSPPYKFSCQHGPVECQGNIYHNCVQKYIKNQSLRIMLTTCMFKKVFNTLSKEKANWSKIVGQCSEQLGLSSYLPRIQDCASSLEGYELLHQAGVKTGTRNFIPTMVLLVEGEQVVLDNRELVKDMKSTICDSFYTRLGKIIQ